jgi:hypothetical protein
VIFEELSVRPHEDADGARLHRLCTAHQKRTRHHHLVSILKSTLLGRPLGLPPSIHLAFGGAEHGSLPKPGSRAERIDPSPQARSTQTLLHERFAAPGGWPETGYAPAPRARMPYCTQGDVRVARDAERYAAGVLYVNRRLAAASTAGVRSTGAHRCCSARMSKQGDL